MTILMTTIKAVAIFQEALQDGFPEELRNFLEKKLKKL